MTPGALIGKENAVPRSGGASKPAQQLCGRRPLGVRDTNLLPVVVDRMESSKAAPPQRDGGPKRSSLVGCCVLDQCLASLRCNRRECAGATRVRADEAQALCALVTAAGRG